MRFSITETTQTESHRKTSNQARAKWRNDNPAGTRYKHVPTTFVCVDGEGVTLPNGEHRYVLLGVGDKQICDPSGLSFERCLDFLWSQFRTGSVAYTGFFLTYDFVQMFKSLPEERARMLLTDQGKAKRKPKNPKRVQPFPVEYRGWEFDILGSKRLRIRKAGASRWMHICDTGPFFQKSFLKVIDPAEWNEPVVDQATYDRIAKGKQSRSSAILDDDMMEYNRLENETHSKVMVKLNEGFQSLGIHLSPSQWYGPGQAAQAWLTGRAIDSESLQEITPGAVLDAARMSYFGGWFEIMAHGNVPGVTWEYDINSAYPHIISTLPCLEHGEWIHNDKRQLQDTYTLVYAKVVGDDPHIGAMLHRDEKGNISRPHATEGWYWLHEIKAAENAMLVSRCTILESWTYHPCDCPPPLREVADIYALRIEVGKKTPLGIACKLVPNSLYGKFAQSVGNPKFANAIYASLITAGCRTMILNAIATHPGGTESVRMVATDGVYFSSPHPGLPVSGALGDWEQNEKINLCLFKPGVYWDDKARDSITAGNAPVFKARGVNARDFGKEIGKIDRMFREAGDAFGRGLPFEWPEVEFPLEFAMVTAVQALQRNDWGQAGTLVKDPRNRQSSNPNLKRAKYYRTPDLFLGSGKVRRGIIRSEPKPNEPYEPSHPYEKRFGVDDPFSQENEEAGGITPEGVPGQAVREALGLA